MLQFPSYGAYDNAIRMNMRKGRMYKLERVCYSTYICCKKKSFSYLFTLGKCLIFVSFHLHQIDRGQWDIVTPYDGRTVSINFY